ncbi:hypothetical protein OsI_24254 [Oryza sativa Indica Group]|uniref:Uncharacterized protein n=1 Tax=Oryza sativa subsp. indica TaxID=39946 RepID=A2YGF3_ORYSI|nr:hypothetical protein OsI_24254 [Oryza sativa Indica Group]
MREGHRTVRADAGGTGRAGLIGQAREIFGSMAAKYGMEPGVENYGSLVDVLAGMVEEAEDADEARLRHGDLSVVTASKYSKVPQPVGVRTRPIAPPPISLSSSSATCTGAASRRPSSSSGMTSPRHGRMGGAVEGRRHEVRGRRHVPVQGREGSLLPRRRCPQALVAPRLRLHRGGNRDGRRGAVLMDFRRCVHGCRIHVIAAASSCKKTPAFVAFYQKASPETDEVALESWQVRGVGTMHRRVQ